MSRNTTPSILASLTAYDSSGDEAEEEEEEAVDEDDEPKKGQGQVTVLFHPPPSESSSSLQNPPSLAQQYDDEENFEYERPQQVIDEEELEDMKEIDIDPAEPQSREGGTENGTAGGDHDGNDIDETETADSSSTKKRKVQLPPEPEGACSPDLQSKFARLYGMKMRSKSSVSEQIQRRKDLRNPSIYEKLIIVCNIDEHGTNFPDPPKWDPSSYYDVLDKVQRDEMERRMKEKKAKETVKVDFVTGTAAKKPEPPKPPSAYIRAFGSLAFKN